MVSRGFDKDTKEEDATGTPRRFVERRKFF